MPFVTRCLTSASSGLASSRLGPTVPFVPASFRVWQDAQFDVKMALPSSAPPPPPPPAGGGGAGGGAATGASSLPATDATYVATESASSPSTRFFGIGGTVTETSGGAGYWICRRTTSRIVLSSTPSARDCAKASSRLGPIWPDVPAARSVWQPPHFSLKSCCPWLALPSAASPPVPQPPPTTASSSATARSPRPSTPMPKAGWTRAATARRRVDERRVREVDDDVFRAVPDHLEQLLFELRRRVEVDLAPEGDHVRLAFQLLGLDVEVHRRRSLTACPCPRLLELWLDLLLRLQDLNLLLDRGDVGVVRRELHESLVGLDGRVVVARLLRRRRKRELHGGVVGRELGQALVEVAGLLEGERRLSRGPAEPLVRVRGERLCRLALRPQLREEAVCGRERLTGVGRLHLCLRDRGVLLVLGSFGHV